MKSFKRKTKQFGIKTKVVFNQEEFNFTTYTHTRFNVNDCIDLFVKEGKYTLNPPKNKDFDKCFMVIEEISFGYENNILCQYIHGV